MDADYLELLLAEIATLWRSPLAETELAAWRRTLRPAGRQDLDPGVAARVLLDLKHSERFRQNRPTVNQFLAAYRQAVEQRAQDDMPASTVTAAAALAQARSALAR